MNKAQLMSNKKKIVRSAPMFIGKFIIICWCLFTITIIGWVFLASFSTTREIFTNNLLKTGLHLDGYRLLLKQYNILRYFFNSLIYTTIACAGLIIVCAPAAYALSKYEFKGKRWITMAYSSALGLPSVMLMAPLFIMFTTIGMGKSIVTLWMIYIGTGIPFTIFYLLGFFSTIPKEIEEAGLIDGCSHIKVFWKIIFPLAQPGIITVTIFNFITYWNEYIWALTLANAPSKKTIAVGLQAIIQGMGNTGNYTGLFAAVVLVFLPTLILFVLLQEKIMGDITSGGVKG